MERALLKLKGLPRLELGSYMPLFIMGDMGKSRIDLEYFYDKKKAILYARVIYGELAQGPPNHAHGGAISSVLDEAMGLCAWIQGLLVMTAKITINYLKPVRLKEPVLVTTWVEGVDGKKVSVRGELKGKEGLLADSHGLFIILQRERFEEMGGLPPGFIDGLMALARD